MVDNDTFLLDPRDFSKKKLVGRGQYGEVYKCTHTQFGNVAIKQVWSGFIPTDDQSQMQSLKDEANIMRKLKNKYIVELFGIILKDDNCSLVLEYMCNGNLLNFLKKGNQNVPWPLRARILLEVIQGMLYVHGRKIIHQDLKPENVLVDNNFHAKIADFGVSVCQTWSRLGKAEQCSKSITIHDEKKRGMGTVAYMAPERADPNLPATEKSDMYSFAILTWVLITQREPYEHFQGGDITSHIVLMNHAVQGKRPDMALIPPDTPYTMVKLMESCWTQKPEERPNFPECKDMFEPFYNASYKDQIPATVTEMKSLLVVLGIACEFYQTLRSQAERRRCPEASHRASKNRKEEEDDVSKMRLKMSNLLLETSSQSSQLVQSDERGDSRSSNRDSQEMEPKTLVIDDELSFDCHTGPMEDEEPTPVYASENAPILVKPGDEHGYREKHMPENHRQPGINQEPDLAAIMNRKVSNRPFEEQEEYQRPEPVLAGYHPLETTSSDRENYETHRSSRLPFAEQQASSGACSEWQMRPSGSARQLEDSQRSTATSAATSRNPQSSLPSTNLSAPCQDINFLEGPASLKRTAIPSGPIPEQPRTVRSQQPASAGPMGTGRVPQKHVPPPPVVDFGKWPFNMSSQSSGQSIASPGCVVHVASGKNIQIGNNNKIIMNSGCKVKQPPMQHKPSKQSQSSSSKHPLLQSFKVAGMTRAVNDNDLRILTMRLSNDWMQCARLLGLEDGKIEAIRYDYHRDGQLEMIVQMLNMWRRAQGRHATMNVLAEALHRCGRYDILTALDSES